MSESEESEEYEILPCTQPLDGDRQAPPARLPARHYTLSNVHIGWPNVLSLLGA